MNWFLLKAELVVELPPEPPISALGLILLSIAFCSVVLLSQLYDSVIIIVLNSHQIIDEDLRTEEQANIAKQLAWKGT